MPKSKRYIQDLCREAMLKLNIVSIVRKAGHCYGLSCWSGLVLLSQPNQSLSLLIKKMEQFVDKQSVPQEDQRSVEEAIQRIIYYQDNQKREQKKRIRFPQDKDDEAIVLVNLMTDTYTKEELITLFRSLQQQLEQHPEWPSFVLLSDVPHAAMAHFNAESKRWVFFDPNFSLEESIDSLTQENTVEAIIPKIQEAFARLPSDHVPFITLDIQIACYLKHQHQITTQIVDPWKEKPEVKKIKTSVTKGKANWVKANNSALLVGLYNGNRDCVMKWLSYSVADLSLVQGSAFNAHARGWTPFHFAAQSGDPVNLNFLVEAIKDSLGIEEIDSENIDKIIHFIDAKTANNCTPLWIAAQTGNLAAIQIFIKLGADVNCPNNEGVTPLYIAVQHNHLEACQELVNAKADVNYLNEAGNNPLLMAVDRGYFEIAQLLIEHGADVNYINKNKASALWIAAQHGNLAMCRVLFKGKAKIDLVNHDGISPLWITIQNGHLNVCKFLINAGANVNQANNHGITLLQIAVVQGHRDIVSLLLKHHANHKILTKDKKNLYDLAIEYNHRDLATYLKPLFHQKQSLSHRLYIH